MKKALILAILLLVSITVFTAYASDGTMKIAMDGEVKKAKDIGTGKGITFTLPELENDDFYIYAVELAVFEKQNGENEWHIYKNKDGIESKKKYIENPTSLTFNVDFGAGADYADKAKYKIAYRYYIRSLQDISIMTIAGEEIKEGWRLVGEEDSSEASIYGFTFYANAKPEINIEYFSYMVHVPNGLEERTVSDTSAILFPKDVFENGISVCISAYDFDVEDILTASYRLEDAATGNVIRESELMYDTIITTDYIKDSYRLYVTLSDNFGESVTSEAYTFNIDSKPPEVKKEFDDGGYALMGGNLFSDFIVTDGNNEPLTDGSVYAEIKLEGALHEGLYLSDLGNGVFRLDQTEMPDGCYTVELQIFDKSGNMSKHDFSQTLDNTPPTIYVFSPEEDPEATYYSKWMNETKRIKASATDELAGVRICGVNLNGTIWNYIQYPSSERERNISSLLNKNKTGKISVSIYAIDDAKGIDKGLNRYKEQNGNKSTELREVWIDKTPPTITIRYTDSEWISAPYTLKATFVDNKSSPSVNDASGIYAKLYSINMSPDEEPEWQNYSEGITFTEGGVYYVHFKGIDNAGNETTEMVRVRLNSSAIITGRVRPVTESMHTIYYSTPGFYVVKNTAYNTRYHFELSDDDLNDVIRTNVLLINKDDNSIYSESEVYTYPDGNNERDIIFNMPYIDNNLRELPDGVYDMFLNVSEIKNDGEEIPTYEKYNDCEVVIKRNSPPTPIINTVSGKVSITYPDEELAGSLNNETIKVHYKYQYKTVKDGDPATNTYKTYTGEFDVGNFIVTALYTDIAGNVSTASKRITQDTAGGVEILTEGNTVTAEESRAADVYYIGTRREKNNGINNEIFGFVK